MCVVNVGNCAPAVPERDSGADVGNIGYAVAGVVFVK
jgi:hypothetical protein